MRLLIIGFGLVLCALAGPAVMLASAGPADAMRPVLVIAPDAANIVSNANGQLVSPATAPLAALATGSPEFMSEIYMSSAWLVIDGQWLANLCGVEI